jgi:hypothetical protein
MTSRSTLWGLILGLGLMLTAAAAPDRAGAQCCAPPPPPVCCTPPAPPPCCVTPTPPACCTSVNIPGVNVNVGANVIVNASASANVSAGARAGAVVFVGGGGGWSGGFAPPTATGVVALNVEGGRRMKRTAYQATRSRMTRVVIQAVCIDDREIPHPASQVSPDREIADAFDGEMYRCLAGTHLQATWAEYLGKVDFAGGKTIACQKGDALYHAPGGKVECRRQKAARDCNERSLLRRFGAGIKVLTMMSTETYTAYREEEERVESAASTMSLDGGVGGIAY